MARASQSVSPARVDDRYLGRRDLQVAVILLPALRETAKRITEDIALVFALRPLPTTGRS